MNTNALVMPSPTSAKYWSELKDLSDNVKLELITLLSSSMTHPEEPAAKPRKGWASRFAGVWKDSRSAEDIVEDIRAARTANTFDADLTIVTHNRKHFEHIEGLRIEDWAV